jgi:parallel beta-helix repeat protein
MNINLLKKLVSLAIVVTMLLGCKTSKDVNITDFGAVADSTTMNTAAIQKAIDEVSNRGGGKVIIPAGKFLTGVLEIKSNVELHLLEGAILLGSANRTDYGKRDASALIVANNAKNIAITGKGTIDGNGEKLIKNIYEMLHAGTLEDTEWKTYNSWHQLRPEERNRPKLLRFANCDSVRITGVTMKSALCWVQEHRECTNMLIDGIRVESTTFLNNDGIDLVDCKNAKISNCYVNACDDGICLKSSNRNSCCENILIENCKVRSSASAVKFGTASWGGFKKITVRNIEIWDTYRSAIALEVVDGGVMEDIDIRNIKAKNTGNAIFMRLGHRNKDSVYSQFRNVYIKNVTVDVPLEKPDKGYPEEGPIVRYPHNVFPSGIVGIPGHIIENVTLEDITINYEGGADQKIANFALDTLGRLPEKISDYPEFSMFGEMPTWGFFIRHAKGVTFKNVVIKTKNSDYRPAVIVMDAEDIKFQNSEFQQLSGIPTLVSKDVKNLKLEKVKGLTDKDLKESKLDKL